MIFQAANTGIHNPVDRKLLVILPRPEYILILVHNHQYVRSLYHNSSYYQDSSVVVPVQYHSF